jgi:MFS family permease
VQTALDFFPPSSSSATAGSPDPDELAASIAAVAYFFTTTALLHGTGNFFWVPVANKLGRRPVYIASYTIYLATAIWLIFERSYGGFLAGRILMGFGAGAAETIAPVSIADVFFLHERGAVMAYALRLPARWVINANTCQDSTHPSCPLVWRSVLSFPGKETVNRLKSCGMTNLVRSLITIQHQWRVIYQVAAALVALILLLAIFTFPETAYKRDDDAVSHVSTTIDGEKPAARTSSDAEQQTIPRTKRSYVQSLRIYNKILTEESLVKMFFRPLGLICLPPVLWAALVQSVTIGFLVAVTSNVAPAFQQTYGFEPYQVGLCFVAAIVGSVLGIPAGGQLGDKVADWFTKRNGGIRDPEMRLPGMMLCLITAPLALILYGVGIQHQLHWMCPTVGLGLRKGAPLTLYSIIGRSLTEVLVNFSIAQGTNICLVYVIDSYRPIAGEVTLAVMGFKCKSPPSIRNSPAAGRPR